MPTFSALRDPPPEFATLVDAQKRPDGGGDDREQSRSRLEARYRQLVREFAARAREELSCGASLLAREALAAGLEPQDVVEIHAAVLDKPAGTGDRAYWENGSWSLLREVMAVFEAHEQVVELLSTLQRNYRDLEQRREAFERAQDELRSGTARLPEADVDGDAREAG